MHDTRATYRMQYGPRQFWIKGTVFPCFTSTRSTWSTRSACSISSKPSRNIIVGLLVVRVRKYFFRCSEFYELSYIQKSGHVRHAGRLLHVMGHDYDRNVFFQMYEKFLNFCGGEGIKGRRGFVEEKYLRFHRQCPR